MDIDEAMEKFGNSFRDAKRGPQAQAELFNMYGAALTRVAELEAQVGEAVFHETDRRNAWKVADKNAARVKELEARLVDQEWRPVTGDDLPEDHDEVLVTVENDDGYRFVDMAEFTVGGNWWQRIDEGWRELKRVTHWRPLPPPPAATE